MVRGTHPNDLDISCVLADFGLAVSQKELPEMEFTHENNTRVGTKRYMSPEVLDFRYVFDHCTLLVLNGLRFLSGLE